MRRNDSKVSAEHAHFKGAFTGHRYVGVGVPVPRQPAVNAEAVVGHEYADHLDVAECAGADHLLRRGLRGRCSATARRK